MAIYQSTRRNITEDLTLYQHKQTAWSFTEHSKVNSVPVGYCSQGSPRSRDSTCHIQYHGTHGSLGAQVLQTYSFLLISRPCYNYTGQSTNKSNHAYELNKNRERSVRRFSGVHIEETGFKQLDSCNLKLLLHETRAFILDKKSSKNALTEFQATSFMQRETTAWNWSFHSRYEKFQNAYTRFQATTLSCSTLSAGILPLPYRKWKI
jgi:hypothetical protein